MEGLGHGKLLLFGEHSVVYGFPGLGIPLNKSVILEPTEKWYGDIDEDLMLAVKSLYHRFKKKYGKGVVDAFRFKTDFPVSGGLGSSAALCIAMLRSMYPDIDDMELWRRARYGENQFHGNSSGIDPALSAATGVTAFYPDEKDAARIVNLGSLSDAGIKNCIVYASVPRQASAKTLISGLGHHIGRMKTESLLQELGVITESAIAAVVNRTIFLEWPELLHRAQQGLAELNLSSPNLDSMLHLDCGSLGAKLSGAGGGGAYFHFFASPGDAQKGLKLLTEKARDIPHLAMPELI